jgi:hypothetical protein
VGGDPAAGPRREIADREPAARALLRDAGGGALERGDEARRPEVMGVGAQDAKPGPLGGQLSRAREDAAVGEADRTLPVRGEG